MRFNFECIKAKNIKKSSRRDEKKFYNKKAFPRSSHDQKFLFYSLYYGFSERKTFSSVKKLYYHKSAFMKKRTKRRTNEKKNKRKNLVEVKRFLNIYFFSIVTHRCKTLSNLIWLWQMYFKVFLLRFVSFCKNGFKIDPFQSLRCSSWCLQRMKISDNTGWLINWVSKSIKAVFFVVCCWGLKVFWFVLIALEFTIEMLKMLETHNKKILNKSCRLKNSITCFVVSFELHHD